MFIHDELNSYYFFSRVLGQTRSETFIRTSFVTAFYTLDLINMDIFGFIGDQEKKKIVAVFGLVIP